MMKQLSILYLLCSLFLALSVSAQEKSTEARQLTLGQPIEGEISGGQTQPFLVTLKQGQFLRAVVNSHDIDVVAMLYGPDGQNLLTVDLLKYRGPEPVSFEAEKAGEYKLEIHTDAAPILHGRYELVSEVKAQAEETDRQRLTAERLLIEANDLEREGSKESLQKSIEKRRDALVFWRKLGDRYWEAYSLHYSGRASSSLNKNQEALAFYNQALSIRKEIGDRIGEAATLNNSGGIYTALGEKEKALNYFNQAVTISKAIGDLIGEARSLDNLGNLFDGPGEQHKALEFYNQALTLKRVVADKGGEANSLITLGTLYYALDEKQKALEFYNQALPLKRAVGDKSGEASTLINLGIVYDALGEKQKALDFYSQALPLQRAVGDKPREASTLINLGNVYYSIGEKQKALGYYNQALLLQRAISDKSGEAGTLGNLAIVYFALGERQKALQYYLQALSLKRAVDDKSGEAATLNDIGVVYTAMGEEQKALEFYNQALLIKRAVGDKYGEANTLNSLGALSDALGEKQKAIEFYNQVLSLRRALGDKRGEADTLIKIGFLYHALDERRRALAFFNQALELQRAIGDKGGEANTLGNLGVLHSELGGKHEALEFFNQALSLKRVADDKSGEADGLAALASVYDDLGEKQKALDFYNQALALRRAVGDKSGEANTLNGLGIVYSTLGEKQKALEFYNQALPLEHAVGDKSGEADTLGNIGAVYDLLGEKQKALEFYDQALLLKRSIRDKGGEASLLINIGVAYSSLGEKQKALEAYNQALPIHRAVGDKGGEANTLTNLGSVYYALAEKQKALEFYNEALPLMRRVGDKRGEAAVLSGLGTVSYDLGEGQKALGLFNEALPLERAVGDKSGEADTLSNIGVVYSSLGEGQKALEAYNQALPIHRAVGKRSGEATALSNIGAAYYALGENRKAVVFFNQAMPLERAVGDKAGEALTLGNLMAAWRDLGKPASAIFYGKQAINDYQQLRGSIQGIEKETQRTFLKRIESVYKRLADLLIAESRLDEATQVINLLRDQEFFDFNRDATQPPGQTVFTAHELATLPLLQVALGKVVSAGQPLITLKRNLANRQPTPAEAAELKRLDADFDKATADFQSTLESIETDFNQALSARDKVAEVPDTRDIQAALRELSTSTKQRVSALYTLIGEDKFHVILIQPDGDLRSFESPIKAADLNEKILQFYALLQSPTYDPRPLGKELYGTIFKPIEGELKKAGVQTLMWQLDGNLRYVPIAALFDGEKYLVERFQNVVFTRADKERMTRAVSSNWTGTGFGSSQAHTVDLLGDGARVNFEALPGVTAELASIFRKRKTDGSLNGNGILDGNVFTDAQFTKSAFYEAMKQRRPLVHISSHFAFRPGDDSRSFLLLGDGKALTLNELKKQTRLFDGVELLTLSACNTALQKADADGREIDGFAELAQRLGAGSVMATLWSVADNSTPWLMREFYQTRQRGAGLTKADGLRRAQLALLDGNAQTQPFPEAQKGSSLLKIVISASGQRDTADTGSSEVIRVEEKDAPLFRRDKKKPFAHPYYWAPFILIGNWK